MTKETLRKMTMPKKQTAYLELVTESFKVCQKSSKLMLSYDIKPEKTSPYYYQTNFLFH